MIDPSGLIQPVNLSVPHLPACLEGVRIAHMSDLHITRPSRRLHRLQALLSNIRVDMVVLTGDYITREGNEDIGESVMAALCEPLRPRLGVYGVFGNHDTPELCRRLRGLPIHWLNNQSRRVQDLPLLVFGFEADRTTMPDSIATLFELESNHGRRGSAPASGQQTKPLRLLLCHFPNYLPIAADLGADIMFAGHTHGGQCRLPGVRALVNSCDLPRRLTAGILRHRNTIAAVSRGLGESRLPVRLFCPPHLPIYTLRRGPLPGTATDQIINVKPW